MVSVIDFKVPVLSFTIMKPLPSIKLFYINRNYVGLRTSSQSVNPGSLRCLLVINRRQSRFSKILIDS